VIVAESAGFSVGRGGLLGEHDLFGDLGAQHVVDEAVSGIAAAALAENRHGVGESREAFLGEGEGELAGSGLDGLRGGDGPGLRGGDIASG